MFDDNRKKIIIIIAVLAVSLLLLFFGWRFLNKKPAGQSADTNTNVVISEQQQAEALPPPSQTRLAEEKDYPLDLKQLAYAFAERLGSYSNVSGRKNLDDLKILTTEQFWNSYQHPVSGADVGSYEGYDTTALSSRLVSFSGSQAEVLVTTQRAHYLVAGVKPEIFYQDLELRLVKAGNDWKVDSAKWQ